jgi:ferritin-like protein
MTFGNDHRTYYLALSVLHEEVEREAWFSEYLREGPATSGAALRVPPSPAGAARGS